MECSKSSGFKFLPILMFSVSAAFRLFGCGRRGYRSENSKQVCFFSRLIAPFVVILSSLISHIARCASRRLDAVRNKIQTSLTFLLSPFTIFVSFFNLQKHIRKKNENQRDIIFRTTLKTVVEGLIKC